MRWTALLAVTLVTSPARGEAPAGAVTAALADCMRQPAESRPYLRYVSLYNVPEKDRAAWEATVSFVCNSLSTSPVIARPARVSDTLLRVDLSAYKISPKDWDRLGDKGSGRTPVPEPYWHKVVETEEVREESKREYWPGGKDEKGVYWEAGYYTVKTKARGKKAEIQALGGWAPKQDVLALVAALDSQQPVYRADWLAYYALLEPRYHELLGLGDKESDFARLAAADEKAADSEGAQARGAVLFSEVAPNNRILERTPTIRLYGRGWYAKSFDFASSVKLEDVLADVPGALSEKAGAHEIITSLRNGLQAYFVSDDKGNRLDRAGIEFARDLRNGFRSPEVEIRNCFACHGGKGMLPVDDEVRATAKGPLAAAASVLAHKDKRQAEKFLEKYAAAPLDDLLAADGKQYQGAVKSATGLEAVPAAAALTSQLRAYEAPLGLAAMAADCGCAEADIREIVPRVANVNSHVAAAVGAGRKLRRDQWEAGGFSAVMEALAASGKK